MRSPAFPAAAALPPRSFQRPPLPARPRRPALPHLHHFPPRLPVRTTSQPLPPGLSAQRHRRKREEGWSGGSWGGAAPCRGQPGLPATWPREQPNCTGPGRGAGVAGCFGPGEEQSGRAGRAEVAMAAGGAQTPRPQHPQTRLPLARRRGPVPTHKLPATRAVRSSLGPRGPAAAAPASLRWRWGMGPRAQVPSSGV